MNVDCLLSFFFPYPRRFRRDNDMLTTLDGTLPSSSFMRPILGVSRSRQLIQEWQFEKITQKEFIFRYVPLKKEGLVENLNKFQGESFKLVFSASVMIEMRQVAESQPSSSGKMRWILNHYRESSA